MTVSNHSKCLTISWFETKDFVVLLNTIFCSTLIWCHAFCLSPNIIYRYSMSHGQMQSKGSKKSLHLTKLVKPQGLFVRTVLQYLLNMLHATLWALQQCTGIADTHLSMWFNTYKPRDEITSDNIITGGLLHPLCLSWVFCVVYGKILHVWEATDCIHAWESQMKMRMPRMVCTWKHFGLGHTQTAQRCQAVTFIAVLLGDLMVPSMIQKVNYPSTVFYKTRSCNGSESSTFDMLTAQISV